MHTYTTNELAQLLDVKPAAVRLAAARAERLGVIETTDNLSPEDALCVIGRVEGTTGAARMRAAEHAVQHRTRRTPRRPSRPSRATPAPPPADSVGARLAELQSSLAVVAAEISRMQRETAPPPTTRAPVTPPPHESGEYRIAAGATMADVTDVIARVAQARDQNTTGGRTALWRELYRRAGVPSQFHKQALAEYWASSQPQGLAPLYETAQRMLTETQLGPRAVNG